MIHIVLVEPEIPPNTGNIARTCAATGTPLHLVEPLGFSIAAREVRRAGLDYWDTLDLHLHPSLESFLNHCGKNTDHPGTLALLTTKGDRIYTDIPVPQDQENLFLLFGAETRGLPSDLLARYPEQRYRIPMRPEQRSLNLSNSVAVVLYELLRRGGFMGLQ